MIGPSGSGKTLLLVFLCSQARKYNPRIIYFDKDRGAEIYIRASGGDYCIISPEHKTGFNPLRLDDTPENRAFLNDWLAMLLTSSGEELESKDKKRIEGAIAGNYSLSKEHRGLSHIAPFLGAGGVGALADRLRPWYGKGRFSYLFDNENDTLDFNNLTVGFDLTHLLDDEAVRAPVIH